MQTRNILLIALLTALAGCQSDVPPKQSEAPVAPAAAPTSPPVVVSVKVNIAEPAPAATPVSPAAAAETHKVVPAAAAKPVPAAPAKPEAKTGGVLSEADALALAKKSNCLVCHSLDKKSVGPAWRAVAVKYRGDAGAEARLMEKIIKGGKGVWGAAAMPPNPQVSEADRRKLIRFILSLK